MNETRTIRWTAGNGSEIEINMVAQFGLNNQGRRKDSGEIEINIDTTIDGESLGPMAGLEMMIGHPVAVAKITNGRKAVAFRQEILDQYNAALAELEGLIADHNCALAAHAASLDAVSERSRQIAKQMAY
jgi:hypothetical protein